MDSAVYFLSENSLLQKKVARMADRCRDLNSFDSLEENVLQTSPRSSSKRKAIKEHHARVIKKRALHSGQGKTPQKSCTHQMRSYCKVNSLTLDDLEFNFSRIYDFKEKTEQERELLMLLKSIPSERRRVADHSRKKKKNLSITYHLLRRSDRECVQVCRSTFLSVLGMPSHLSARWSRVQTTQIMLCCLPVLL